MLVVLLILMRGLFLFVLALSLYVAVDSVRRPVTHFTGLPETRLTYTLLAGSYFLATMVNLAAPNAPLWFNDIGAYGAPIIFALEATYLLRVVFPTPRRLEARRVAEEALDAAAERPERGDDPD